MPTFNHYSRRRSDQPTTLNVDSISANDREMVSFFDASGRQLASISAQDEILVDSDAILVRNEGGQRYLFSASNISSITDSDGNRTNYTPLVSPTQNDIETRIDEVFQNLTQDVFRGCCGSTTVQGGGGTGTPNPLLDSTDTEVTTITEGQSVKMMDSGMSSMLVGGVHQISPGSSMPRVMPVPIQWMASSVASADPNDYGAKYNELVNFYEYGFDHRNIQIDASNPYRLDPSTPNPWGGLGRITSTDGTPSDFTLPVEEQRGWMNAGYGTGTPLIICDWKHRLMWYVANLGNMGYPAFLADIASKNATGFLGYSDWIGATNDAYRSLWPNRRGDINGALNVLRDGIESGYINTGSNARVLTIERYQKNPTSQCRVLATSSHNEGSQFFSYTTDTTGYIFRLITDADITAMGGTP